ncbi:hypothetical protein QJQ45_011061 [Haematococcus lacustris]|nr:hypothetical protein QJQ45_011061 [Haematococcus lacustris]
MKITNAMVGLLSNSEVLRVLHDRGADASQPTVTARANEQMAYHYLTEHSAGLQDTMALQHFIQLLEPFQLTKAEVVGILNLCPSSAVELHLVVEDCETRLNEEQASVKSIKCTTHRHHSCLEEEAASVSQQEWGTRKQLVVCFGYASIGTRGGLGAKAVLQACRKVVERPNSGKPTDRVPGKVVTVDEFRTSRATRGDLGKWVDRDCNAALNLQRAGESKWRPLELCRWPHRGRLPAQGKEYPALGFKKLRDRAPKAQAQQPVAQ